MFKGSWRTTASGVVIGLAAIFTQIGNALDDDPATKFEWSVLAAAAAAIYGLISARDDKVTSESAGAK